MPEIILNDSQKYKKDLILKCKNKLLSTLDVARLTGKSRRRIQQLLSDYEKYGDKVFIHGNKGKKRISEESLKREKKILNIFLNTRINDKNPFFDMNYNYFSYILKTYYNIKASPPYIKKLFLSVNRPSPLTRKTKKKEKHLMRERKEHFGELIQADGKSYDWFNNRTSYCIQGYVDDSTGYPVGLYMTKNECLLGYLESTRNMVTRFGIPSQLYPDKAGVFFVNKKYEDYEKHLTQFGYIMENLGVDMFPAHSPQAKGRIERFWETIQNRLPQLFVFYGIDNVDDANIFLRDKFYDIYKLWFPVEPKNKDSMFVPADINEVNKILKATYTAKVDKGGVFSFKGYRFFTKDLPNTSIMIHINEVEGMWITTNNNLDKRYNVELVETDTSGTMPEVFKILIERIFLKNAKPRYKEVYIDIDDVALSKVKPKHILA